MRHTRLGTIPLRCGLVQAAFPFAALMPRKIVEVKCQLLHVFKVVGLQGMKDKQMKRECYKLRIKSPDPGLPLTPVSRPGLPPQIIPPQNNTAASKYAHELTLSRCVVA
jgi:hypothetical protein